MLNLICIAFGASLGAILRWLISIKLNIFLIDFKYLYLGIFPLGTLLVNLIGGYLIGLLSSIIIFYNLSLELRLFIVVGFLGGFTTFSAFSIESIEFLKNSKFAIFIIHFLLNTFGSIIMTLFGITTFYIIKRFL